MFNLSYIIRSIELHRINLLKQLFLLTKDNQDIMTFLTQEMEGESLLTNEELIREQEYLEKHEFK